MKAAAPVRRREVLYLLTAVRWDGLTRAMGTYPRWVLAARDGRFIDRRWPGWHGDISRVSLPIPGPLSAPLGAGKK